MALLPGRPPEEGGTGKRDMGKLELGQPDSFYEPPQPSRYCGRNRLLIIGEISYSEFLPLSRNGVMGSFMLISHKMTSRSRQRIQVHVPTCRVQMGRK